RKQTWHFPGRAECMTCHNPWAGNGLAFTIPQINRDHEFGGVVDNQVRTLRHIGLIEMLHKENGQDKTRSEGPLPKLLDPYDAKCDLNQTARSDLQLNCPKSHQPGTVGTAHRALHYD